MYILQGTLQSKLLRAFVDLKTLIKKLQRKTWRSRLLEIYHNTYYLFGDQLISEFCLVSLLNSAEICLEGNLENVDAIWVFRKIRDSNSGPAVQIANYHKHAFFTKKVCPFFL